MLMFVYCIILITGEYSFKSVYEYIFKGKEWMNIGKNIE